MESNAATGWYYNPYVGSLLARTSQVLQRKLELREFSIMALGTVQIILGDWLPRYRVKYYFKSTYLIRGTCWDATAVRRLETS